eukprot:6180246-Pleurochrysis_carterae.AAC.1
MAEEIWHTFLPKFESNEMNTTRTWPRQKCKRDKCSSTFKVTCEGSDRLKRRATWCTALRSRVLSVQALMATVRGEKMRGAGRDGVAI